jgi:3',5'-nucleoside bisphosphate phosphatase
VAILAHPGLTQRDYIIEELVKCGLGGIEIFYPTHTQDIVKKYSKIAKKYNLAITGGSDFHGERRIDTSIAKITIPNDIVKELKKKCQL